MISLKNIQKVYRTDTIETLALNSINLDIARGEFLSVMGPSGCGKSTLLNIMGLLDAPTNGDIKIDEQKTGHLSDKQLAQFRNKKLGFIFQSYHLINDLKVLDNVELPLLYRSSTTKERKKLASAALEKVGLSNRMRHFPTQLSGGQKQRTAIARALVRDPKILILDDALSAVDTQTEERILSRLRDIMAGRTTILISHRTSTVQAADQIVVLRDGQIIERGRHEDLLSRGGYYSDLYHKQLLEEELERA